MTMMAMDIMLPGFVTDRIVDAQRAAGEATIVGGSDDDGEGAALLRHGSDADMAAATPAQAMTNFRNDVWSLPGVSIMFIGFAQDGAKASHDVMHEALMRAEATVSDLKVLKVKTVGDAMMCVTGVDAADAKARTRALVRLVRAARVVKHAVAEPLAEAAPGLTCSVGIHTGACFGAVMGDDGLAFDMFGGAVNLACHLQRSAAAGRIQLSLASYNQLPENTRRHGFAVEALDDVEYGAKDAVQAFAVVSSGRAAAFVGGFESGSATETDGGSDGDSNGSARSCRSRTGSVADSGRRASRRGSVARSQAGNSAGGRSDAPQQRVTVSIAGKLNRRLVALATLRVSGGEALIVRYDDLEKLVAETAKKHGGEVQAATGGTFNVTFNAKKICAARMSSALRFAVAVTAAINGDATLQPCRATCGIAAGPAYVGERAGRLVLTGGLERRAAVLQARCEGLLRPAAVMAADDAMEELTTALATWVYAGTAPRYNVGTGEEVAGETDRLLLVHSVEADGDGEWMYRLAEVAEASPFNGVNAAWLAHFAGAPAQAAQLADAAQGVFPEGTEPEAMAIGTLALTRLRAALKQGSS
jgi:class 3 adenylate cyclase